MKGRNLLVNLFVIFMGLTFSVTAQEGNRSANEQMTYMEKARVNQQTGTVDPSDVLDARMQLQKVQQKRALGLDWQEMGPDNFGGHVTTVLLDNQDDSKQTIYVGAFTGGIWKSTDGGLIWEKISPNSKNLFVTDFAQADDGTIYAATGLEGAYAGQGIYKSSNGMDFTQIASTAPASDDQDTWSYISDIEVTNGKIFAATNTGLMISPDSGDSWNQASTEDGTIDGFCNDVEVNDNGVIFTAVEGTSYRSETNASGFVSIAGSADTLLPSNMVKQVKFAVAPTEQNKVYAVATNYTGFLVGVYMTSDDGTTWSLIGPGTDGTGLFSPFADPTNPDQGTADDAASITVSPNDPDVLYVGGTTVFRGVAPQDDGYYTWEREFFSTLGVNAFVFKNNNNYLMATNYGLQVYDRGNDVPLPQPLNNFLNISSFHSVSLGIDDKVIGGEDRFGILHFPMEEVNTDLNAVNIQPGNGGLTERSVINHETLILSLEATEGGGGENMQRSRDMAESFAQNFLIPDIGAESGDYEAQFIRFKLWESLNNQDSRDSVYFKAQYQSYSAGDVVTVRSEAEDYPFEYTLESDLNQGDSVQVKDIISGRLFVAAEQGGSEAEVWMTPDIHEYGRELDWYQIAELGDHEIPSAVAVSESGNYVYVGTEQGTVYRLGNVLAAYDSATANYNSAECVVSNDLVMEEEDRMITSIATDPTDDSHIVVTMGNYGNDNYVYESFDALADEPGFSSIQYNLPKAPVYSSLIEMHNSNRLLIGSEMGVFALENESWTVEQNGVGSLPITQIRQQTKDSDTKKAISAITNGDTVYRVYKGIKNNGVIYMSTFGRGIWKSVNYVGMDEDPADQLATATSLDFYPNPVRDKVTIEMDGDEKRDLDIKIFDINGRLVLSREFESFQAGELTIDVNSLNNGTYLMQLNNGRELQSGKFMILK